MTALIDLSLHEAAQALRAGETSARELTLACIARMEEVDGHVHAFLAQTPDLALEHADRADKMLAEARKGENESLSNLVGIPVAIKDVLTIRGVPTTCGSKILEGYRPPYTATSVQRLIDSGAVILGKTNTDEFAMGSSTENSAYGVTHNPWDLARVPGGSSGGSAAAVAARMCFAALGTDTGGSVRQPAAFCGITGLKPSYGRVSRYGLIAYGSSLDTVGIHAHSAAEMAVLYTTMAGHDELDSTSMPGAVEEIQLQDGDLRGIRVGVPKEYFIDGIQPAVEAAVREALNVLGDLGCELQEISLPHTNLALPVYYIIAPAEASANLARYDGIRFGPRKNGDDLWDTYLKTRGELFGPEVKRRIMLGTYALSSGYYDAYYAQAQKVRTLIKQDFERAFERVDLIASPVTPTTAFPIGAHEDDPLAMYLEDVFTLPANLAGVPGLAFPVGFDDSGLPIGMQITGPHLGEAILFRVTHAYQKATDWHNKEALL
ncbi:MAG: Asp-tRNA(Asn)/Glu-tRNA(Gln) amidotransferase subunit GatA [Chloroflexi bacterium]|nr:Asp-tRNA(Asn)/Glu-tRNA(Gln) amidotransferase subunit GatA [Chloroflexota bacterium]